MRHSDEQVEAGREAGRAGGRPGGFPASAAVGGAGVAVAAAAVAAVVLHWPLGAPVTGLARFVWWLLEGLAACAPVVALGSLLARRLLRGREATPVLNAAAAWCLGWSLVVLAGIALLAAGLYSPWVWRGAWLVGSAVLLAVAISRRWRGVAGLARTAATAWRGDADGPARLLSWRTLLLLLVTFAALHASLPPDTRDEVAYHLVAPRLWAAQGSWWLPAGNPHLMFPGNVELMWSWAMAVAGLGVARFVGLVSGLLALLVLADRLRVDGVDRWTRGACLTFLLVTPVALGMLSIAYVEWPLVLFLVVGWRLAGELEPETGVLVAIAAVWGTCLGVKYTAIPFVALLALGWLVGGRTAGRRLGAVAALAAGALILAAPWYLRAWWVTGDPLYPLGSALLGGAQGADAGRLLHYAAPPGAWSWWPWLYYATTAPVADHRLHVLWPMLELAALGLGWRWRRRLPWVTVVVVTIALLPFAPAPRVLLPLLVLMWLFLAPLTAPVAGAARPRAVATGVLLVVALLSVPFTLYDWFLTGGRAAPDYLMGLVDRGEYLRREGLTGPAVEWVEERTPPDARIWAWCTDRVLYLDRWVMPDSPYALPSFAAAAESGGGAALDAAVRRDGIGYVLVDRSHCAAPFSELAADQRSWAVPADAAAAVRRWIEERLEPVVRDDRFELYRVRGDS